MIFDNKHVYFSHLKFYVYDNTIECCIIHVYGCILVVVVVVGLVEVAKARQPL